MTLASSLAVALAWLSRGVARVLRSGGGWVGAGGMGETAAVISVALGAAVGAVGAVLAAPAAAGAEQVPGTGRRPYGRDHFVGAPSRFGPLFATHPALATWLDQLARMQRERF
jgi:hypothetical protein